MEGFGVLILAVQCFGCGGDGSFHAVAVDLSLHRHSETSASARKDELISRANEDDDADSARRRQAGNAEALRS